MAALQRHASLRFSVFEVAAGIGLETNALDGNFDPITEEDEREVRRLLLRPPLSRRRAYPFFQRIALALECQ